MKAPFLSENSPSAVLRIAILTELRLLRECLERALEEDQSIALCGAFSDLLAALMAMAVNPPDIILIDQAFPSALTAIHDLNVAVPDTLAAVIAVTETSEEVFSWIEAGAAGYIPKTAGLAEIVPLLHGIRNGEQSCAPSVAGALLHRLFLGGPSPDAKRQTASSVQSLTVREKQIAQLIAMGMSNKEIACYLKIGVATTKTHVHHLLSKMNVRRRGQAAKYISENRVR
jgi:two-component system nitrate/nitrite response regulator NarL